MDVCGLYGINPSHMTEDMYIGGESEQLLYPEVLSNKASYGQLPQLSHVSTRDVGNSMIVND